MRAVSCSHFTGVESKIPRGKGSDTTRLKWETSAEPLSLVLRSPYPHTLSTAKAPGSGEAGLVSSALRERLGEAPTGFQKTVQTHLCGLLCFCPCKGDPVTSPFLGSINASMFPERPDSEPSGPLADTLSYSRLQDGWSS